MREYEKRVKLWVMVASVSACVCVCLCLRVCFVPVFML